MTYFEKLKHPLWQKKRLEVFERENFTCQLCETTDKTLHIHHTYYKPDYEPWDYPSDSLMCLCEDCHEGKKKRKEYLKIIEENADTFLLEYLVGIVYSHEMFIKKEKDKNIQIELTYPIITGMCKIYKDDCDEKVKLFSFLSNYIKKGRKTITYGEIIDFIESQETKE